ncbi:MAG TPA: biotin--[acetyl-CoA-carboxylase] ligase [Anaerolineaceae bacterium]|mgnify:CR=1 FL=1|nr:biotin--[acetyl-CoA-carboxylase] ligase [Anaerolineaceae bacterium]HPN51309.1 biotin--[acetyl-CoA-carboxylase] ligase [Anaerolineaceae bacterium]
MPATFDALLTHLSGLPLGDWQFLEETGSTNDVALTWAMAGCPDFSLVVANSQTAGRGRLARRWFTNPNSALAFSLVVRPTPAEMPALNWFAPLGGLAVSEALLGLGLAAEIKWPNDVLVGGRKLCGILSETVWAESTLKAVVLGIGINIAPSSVPPADQLQFPATCVEDELGSLISRWELLRDVLWALAQWRARLKEPAFLAAWQERLAFKGQWVRVAPAGREGLLGMVSGIDPSGALVLLDHNGTRHIIEAGDVHLRPA